jgi:hypothetical protein
VGPASRLEVQLASPPPIQLDVGGISFQVHLPTEALRHLFEEHYRSFQSDAPVDWHVTLAVDPSLEGSTTQWVEHQGAVTRFTLTTQSGWVDLDRRQASICIADWDQARVGLSRIMSYVCLQALPRYHNALFVHGAGISIDGEGYIFFGASGRGKSTVSRLAEGVGEVLCDEGVIVRLGRDGPELVSTPFWGSGTPVEQIQQVEARCVPLRAMYSLVHAPDFKLTSLGSARAVMELLTSEKIATERVASADAWLKMAHRVVEVVPVYRLEFLPTGQLWNFLKLNGGSRS